LNRRANTILRPARTARDAARNLAAAVAGIAELKAELSRISDGAAELGAKMADIEEQIQRLGGESPDANKATIEERIGRLGDESLGATRHARDDLLGTLERRHEEIVEILELLHDDEPGNRRRLWEMRDAPTYPLAYEEAEPLVTVAIATYTNIKGLVERALPSVLAQEYERIEVVIVGDGASPEVEAAVRALRDDRIQYANLTHRGPYPIDPKRRWFVAGGPGFNEAMRLARGSWIAPMDDDDASAPDHVAALVKAAQERRLECCYGRIRERLPNGSTQILGEFPPRLTHGGINRQASIRHAGLTFIASELGDALFGIPGDWSTVRRMMRIGVRIGMIEDVIVDHYPSKFWLVDERIRALKQAGVEEFDGFSVLEGLGSPEGPYPQWDLPSVCWGYGTETVLIVPSGPGAQSVLSLACRTDLPDQVLGIWSNGTRLLEHRLAADARFAELDVPLPRGAGGEQEVRICYAAQDSSAWPHPAVLYSRLRVSAQ
jgi:hypothetical protein